MNEILMSVIFLTTLFSVVAVVTYYALRDSGNVSCSKYILNKFEPSDASSDITEMIDFHKKNGGK